MMQKRQTTEQIIAKPRRAEVELGKGQKVPDVSKLLSITEQTYYGWRQKYGGMAPEMAKELKALQQENAQLKKLVANQALDMEILKECFVSVQPRLNTNKVRVIELLAGNYPSASIRVHLRTYFSPKKFRKFFY
jgi:bisphosphoglycerate-dependent phosphoglycerate mutase